MEKTYRNFGIVSVFFLIVMAISPARDYFREWRTFQNEYNEFIKEQPRRIEPVDIGIKQIWINDLNRVDRCVSCHVGLDVKSFENVKQPFTSHPKTVSYTHLRAHETDSYL